MSTMVLYNDNDILCITFYDQPNTNQLNLNNLQFHITLCITMIMLNLITWYYIINVYLILRKVRYNIQL